MGGEALTVCVCVGGGCCLGFFHIFELVPHVYDMGYRHFNLNIEKGSRAGCYPLSRSPFPPPAVLHHLTALDFPLFHPK